MATMIYQYKDYYFESGDSRILLAEDDYNRFVENCRKLIQEDREKGFLARKELVGATK